jgi:serine/threonine-protein kinase
VRCLQENTLFEFVQGCLGGEQRRAVAQHADACDSCRRLIAAALEAVAGSSEHEGGDRLLAGKYQLIRPLGAGGMGAVHEAINTLTGRKVAIKILHSRFSSDPDAVQRFTQEARSATRIAHANVVEILDLGEDESGAQFMVQELLTGSTLRERLDERGRLSIEEVVAVLEPALAGLVVAHQAGVVHRDIKPENIFLAVDPLGLELTKLIDFGLSKVVADSARLAITDHGRQLGTPFYMSPEQLQAARDIDGRTDVWSMGVVLFEAIAGVRPFSGPSYNELVAQVLTAPVPRLATLVPGVPPAFSALVERALERDRERRFAARELLEALRALPTAAQPRARRTSRRRLSWRISLVLTAVVALGAGHRLGVRTSAVADTRMRSPAAVRGAIASATAPPAAMSARPVAPAPLAAAPPEAPLSAPRAPARRAAFAATSERAADRVARVARERKPQLLAPVPTPAPDRPPLGANRAPIFE